MSGSTERADVHQESELSDRIAGWQRSLGIDFTPEIALADSLAARLQAAEGERDGLRIALEHYGDHHPDCSYSYGIDNAEPNLRCSCGYHKALAAASTEGAALDDLFVPIPPDTCPICGHEWRRHDPEDGCCDAPSYESPGVCECGRDMAWMHGKTAALSRAALASTEGAE